MAGGHLIKYPPDYLLFIIYDLYIVVWKEEKGNWKMYRDIWNSDPPAPQAHRGGPPPQN